MCSLSAADTLGCPRPARKCRAPESQFESFRGGARVNTRHLFRAVVPVALGAVALAGCGGGSSGGGSTGGGGGGGKSFTIGFQGPLSGGVADLGINERNAVQLAIEQANKNKTLPYTIKFEQADAQPSADASPPAARKLTGDDNVIAV